MSHSNEQGSGRSGGESRPHDSASVGSGAGGAVAGRAPDGRAGGDGPRIGISASPRRVRVLFGGRVIADSTRALLLTEGRLPAVRYVPREDCDMSLLDRTAHSSHCPWKGEASYFTIRVGERVTENAIWSYETPNPDVSAIAGCLAFYPDRVDAIEEAPIEQPSA